MTTSETYSWCLFFASGLLAWFLIGPLGFICLVSGMAISHIEVGWIDQHVERLKSPPPPEPDPGEALPEPKLMPKRRAKLPPNVIPLRRKA